MRALVLFSLALVAACDAPAGDRRAAEESSAAQGAVVTNTAPTQPTSPASPAPAGPPPAQPQN